MNADAIIRDGERQVVMNVKCSLDFEKAREGEKVYVIDSKRSDVTEKVKNLRRLYVNESECVWCQR